MTRTDLIERIITHCGSDEDVNGCEYIEIFIGAGELSEVLNMVFNEAIKAVELVNSPLRAGGAMVVMKQDVIRAIEKLKDDEYE